MSTKILLFNPKIDGRQTQGFYKNYSGCFYRRYYVDYEYINRITNLSYEKMKRKNVKFEKTNETAIYYQDKYSNYENDIFKEIEDIDKKVRTFYNDGKIQSDECQKLITKRLELVKITKKFSKELKE
jgi:hypothetical protein